MRITFFHHSLILGSGIDTGIYELARRLGRRHEVTVLTFASDYPSIEPAFLRILPTSVVPRSRAGLFAALDPAARAAARGFLGTQEAVNVHTYPANVLAYRVRGPRHVATEWGAVDPALFPRGSERAYVRVATWAERRYCRAAHVVLSPCPFAARWTEEHFGVRPRVTFLDGINFEVFDRDRVDAAPLHARWPTLAGGPVVLYNGRLTPSKNLESLIEAFALVHREFPSAVLALVGKASVPSYAVRLSRRVADLGLRDVVVFTGVVSWDDLARFYKLCDVYATASLWEGFLRAEAFAMAKPMVAYDTAANPDTVIDGTNGLLVRDRTATALARAILRLLNDRAEARRLGEAGYRWARANLDFDAIASRFGEIVEEARRVP